MLDNAARILLIDSDVERQNSLKQTLASHYAVDAVTDITTAFNRDHEHEKVADLVLANIQTGKICGVNLIRELRNNRQFQLVPIIVYTSRGGEELCADAMEAGANDCLTTPFSERRLLAYVRAQMRTVRICEESLNILDTSVERYRTLLRSANAFIWTAAPNGEIVGDVPDWGKMTGQTPDEYRGFGWTAAVHRDDRERVLETWEKALQETTDLDIVYRVRHRDGAYRYAGVRGTPIKNPDGSVREWIGSVVDLDERKRAEDALRTREEEFRANFELAGIGQAQVDLSGKFVRVNPRFSEMVGYSADELQTMTFLDITHPEDRESNVATMQPLMRGEVDKYTVEKRYVRKDGTIIWGQVTATMLRDAEGGPLRTIAMVQDITERRLSEAVFQFQKVVLEMVAQGAPLEEVLQFVTTSVRQHTTKELMVCIMLLDGDGKQLRLGAASGLPESCVQILKNGVPADEVTSPALLVVKKRQPVFVADLDADPDWEAFRHKVAPYGVRAVWSIPIIASDQRLLGTFCIYYRQPRTSKSVEQWIIETVTRTVALAIERKQAEAEREEMLLREQAAREQAEMANRTKDEFLAVVSHELRTPLTAISGWVNLLLEGQLNELTKLRALQAIQRQSRSQRQLIDDLLDVSRIVSGKLRVDFKEVEPSRIINAAMDVVRPTLEAKNVHLVVDLDGQERTLSGDPERLQQVIWNLLSNAIKFTAEGGRITIRSRWSDSSIEIAVSDNGQGISPDFLPYVFERFRQADVSTTRAYGGLGLGLAIVRYIVEIHGGTVRAESAGKGKGATFTVRLPGHAYRHSAVSKDGPESKQEVTGHESKILDGLCVLLVDDDSDAREIAAFQLEQYGAGTLVAGSADEALRKLETFNPDVIVADIGMPNEDGYSMIRRVRNSGLGHMRIIPAIALTAYAGDGNRQRAIDAGYQQHISKPADPRELALAIATLAGRSLATDLLASLELTCPKIKSKDQTPIAANDPG